jgi:hypothetical protein
MNLRWSSSPSWDTRVVFIERQQRWWWNAWLAATETELYGFADTHEDASRAMNRAIRQTELTIGPPPEGQR